MEIVFGCFGFYWVDEGFGDIELCVFWKAVFVIVLKIITIVKFVIVVSFFRSLCGFFTCYLRFTEVWFRVRGILGYYLKMSKK